MTKHVSLLVFSDLDGTLLDHQLYDWSAARDALAALKKAKAGLILASSKTAPEMARLRADIGFEDWPAIIENGAGILPAGATSLADVKDYAQLRSTLNELPAHLREKFIGFGDMDAKGVAKITGLSLHQAELAKTRSSSEPGIWQGSQEELDDFLSRLKTSGIISQRGGRFVTLSFGANKADRLCELIKEFQPVHTVALGDAPNDIKMMECADFGVVVANPHGPEIPQLKGETNGRIIRTHEAGPIGWNTAILDLLDKLTLNRT